MSGGSWDYVFNQFYDVAERLKKSRCPYRRALGKQLEKISEAMHDIEWVDSADWGPGDDIPAIKAALGDNEAQVTASVLAEVQERLADEIKLAQSGMERLMGEAE